MENTVERCLTCKLVAQRDAGTAPLWDSIYRTLHWDVVHAYNTSLPGWLVLVARRHMVAVDEMTEDEAAALGPLLRHVSLALRASVGCAKTYVMQFAEATDHPHVHFHVVPRMADQPADRRGPAIFGYLGVPDDERVREAEMNRIGGEIRHSLGEVF
jgi:diadenosine tetraphosphate (Ap4A) HIT family hydrolase